MCAGGDFAMGGASWRRGGAQGGAAGGWDKGGGGWGWGGGRGGGGGGGRGGGGPPPGRGGGVGEVAIESGEAEGAEWEQEWVAHHYRLAMRTVRESFEPRSVEVFERSVAGSGVAELAVEYGMSEQAVHMVRQRIKARMEELIA